MPSTSARPAASTRVNPDLLKGWGVRPVDWQWGINLQQELAPRVSLEVGYNRRWWGNYTVTDNTAVGPGGLSEVDHHRAEGFAAARRRRLSRSTSTR